MLPFSLIGSDFKYEVDGKMVLARKYPWGIVEGKKLNKIIKYKNKTK